MKNLTENFIPLYNDLLFKESLAQEENREVLEYFLEIFLDLGTGALHGKLRVEYESQIRKLEYHDKAIRADLLVYYDDKVINLECYSNFDNESLVKTLCYAMRLASNIRTGENYSWIQPVKQLVFVKGFAIFFDKKQISKYLITDTTDLKNTLAADRFQIYYYRLDNAQAYNYNVDRKTKIQCFIGAESAQERAKIAKGDKILMKFDEQLNTYTMDETTKELFAKWSEQIYQHQAERRGKKEGLVEAAKNMITENVPLPTIMKCTGLSEEEIIKLQ